MLTELPTYIQRVLNDYVRQHDRDAILFTGN